MILIDILQDYCKRIYRTEEKFYDLEEEDISGISYPDISKSEREIRDLIVVLTQNNIWTVEDLKNKFQNK